MCSALYCAILATYPANCLAAAGTRDKCRMRITQSISLSKIRPFRLTGKARPKAVETSRTVSKDLPGLSPDRRPLSGNPEQRAAIRKQ
jgi:hypothetical protein